MAPFVLVALSTLVSARAEAQDGVAFLQKSIGHAVHRVPVTSDQFGMSEEDEGSHILQQKVTDCLDCEPLAPKKAEKITASTKCLKYCVGHAAVWDKKCSWKNGECESCRACSLAETWKSEGWVDKSAMMKTYTGVQMEDMVHKKFMERRKHPDSEQHFQYRVVSTIPSTFMKVHEAASMDKPMPANVSRHNQDKDAKEDKAAKDKDTKDKDAKDDKAVEANGTNATNDTAVDANESDVKVIDTDATKTKSVEQDEAMVKEDQKKEKKEKNEKKGKKSKKAEAAEASESETKTQDIDDDADKAAANEKTGIIGWITSYFR